MSRASVFIRPLPIGDHLSQPFDATNIKAIGTVINKAISDIGVENLQIFLFDDEDFQNLSLTPNHSESLVTEEKTGFVPFYFPIVKTNDIDKAEDVELEDDF